MYIRKPRSILKKLNKNSENPVGSCAPFCGERNMMKQRKIELLAPAKNLECGIAAVDHGADAIYIGAPRFGARAAAGNSLEDIAELVRYAHVYNVRIYVTVNTILKDEELKDTEKMIMLRQHVPSLSLPHRDLEAEKWQPVYHSFTMTTREVSRPDMRSMRPSRSGICRSSIR